LYQLYAQDGAKNVQVGSAIAIVGEEGDDISSASGMVAQAASRSPAKENKSSSVAPTEGQPHSPPKTEPKPQKLEIPPGDRIFASPIAKKIALERGIPLAQIKGSGPMGRVVREDVEKYKPSSTTSHPLESSSQLPDYYDTPVSNVRRTIASRLTKSKLDVPHYYLTLDVNMDKVLKLREIFNKTLSQKDKTAKLSVNDFIVKAVACALADVPEANSAWLGEVIRT
jgi:pyruvate dehydrogenase E2 component (dihydrolipoamide acetyltransferase)